jgi:hypothetical protein
LVTVRAHDLEMVADGETSCTADLRRASEILREAGGGTLDLDDGDYLVDDTVVFDWDNIRLAGNGRAARILNGCKDKPAIILGAASAEETCSGCAVERLSIAQAPDVKAGPGNKGILLRYLDKAVIDRVEVTPYPAPLYDGLHLEHVSQSSFDRSGANDCLNDGVTLRRCVDIDGYAVRAVANGRIGFRSIASEGMQLFAWKAYGNRKNAWRFEAENGARNMHWFLTACVGDTSGEDDWFIDQMFDLHLTACWGSAHLDTGVNPTARGFAVTAAATSLRFVSGGALACNGDGVAILGAADDVQFSNFSFGSPYPEGRGNGKGAKGGYGLRLHKDATNVIVRDGQARGNASGSILGNATTIVRDVVGHPAPVAKR